MLASTFSITTFCLGVTMIMLSYIVCISHLEFRGLPTKCTQVKIPV